jgi:hypothetical protein
MKHSADFFQDCRGDYEVKPLGVPSGEDLYYQQAAPAPL